MTFDVWGGDFCFGDYLIGESFVDENRELDGKFVGICVFVSGTAF